MSTTTENTIPSTPQAGEIPALLVKEGFVTAEQLAYARRVQAKLSSNKTLIDTIMDLGYITDEQIRGTLSKNHLSIRIGALLVELGYIRESDLTAALNLQKESAERKKLGEILIEHGYIDERKFIEILASQLGFPLIELEYRKLDRKLFANAPFHICREFLFAPIARENGEMLVVFADPLDKRSRDAAEKFFGHNLKPAIAAKKAILEVIAVTEKNAGQPDVSAADESTIIGIINKLIEDAISDNASDIHIEPMKDRIRVRFRYDGVMMQHRDLPLEMGPPLSSRIKVMAQADIAEKRRHQDGRILFESQKHG